MLAVPATKLDSNPAVHKGFRKAVRHVLTHSERRLEPYEEYDLRIGLGGCSASTSKWLGNATISFKNAHRQERVVRVYQNPTLSLMYEARYRPDKKGILRMHEFAYEHDASSAQNSMPGTLNEHLSRYDEAHMQIQSVIKYHVIPCLTGIHPYAFDFEKDKVQGFKSPGRFELGGGPLNKENERLLRMGLGRIDMDHRWMGNLALSAANAGAQERVVRLYRTWTGAQIYEARYRPNAQGELVQCSFAYEGDPGTYSSSGVANEFRNYESTLAHVILVIKDKMAEIA